MKKLLLFVAIAVAVAMAPARSADAHHGRTYRAWQSGKRAVCKAGAYCKYLGKRAGKSTKELFLKQGRFWKKGR